MTRRVQAVAALGLAVTLLVTGCGATQLPTYEQVTDETTTAMQAIADQMPPGSEIEDVTVPTPYTCGPSSDGVFFTGHWFVHATDGFDTRAFIESLPENLGDGFTVLPPGVEISYPGVLLRAQNDNVRIDVSNPNEDEYPGIDILAMSRCAQEPPAAE
ncbi:hypothetical protein [Microbacterium aurum]